MKKRIVIAISLMCFVVGCIGKVPVMVDTFQYGDDKRSCESLDQEILSINDKIEGLYKKRNEKIGANVLMGTVGMVLFFPALLLMDTKSDELAEIDSCLGRRRVLCQIFHDNGCGQTVESNEAFLARIGRKAPDEIRKKLSNESQRTES